MASREQVAGPETLYGGFIPVPSPSHGNSTVSVAKAAAMAPIYQRLRRGKPTSLDQLIFRLPGVALLAGCWRLMAVILATAAARHATAPDAAHLVLPMLAVLCLISGLWLCVLGPGLLEEVPWPATSRYRPQASRPGSAPEHRS